MSAINWLRRSSGLVIPSVGFANLAGKMQPCPDADCCLTVSPCGNCTITPLRFEVTIAGVGGPSSPCDAAWCDGWNGTHVVEQYDAPPLAPLCSVREPPCNWCKQWTTASGSNAFSVYFAVNGDFYIRLETTSFGSQTAYYKTSSMPANCSSWVDESLPLWPGSTLCCTLPATVTISAV